VFRCDEDQAMQDYVMTLEMELIEQYLGRPLSSLRDLEPGVGARLRREACLHAALRLEEIKARGHWVHALRGSTSLSGGRLIASL
jgi:hypothetical protein